MNIKALCVAMATGVILATAMSADGIGAKALLAAEQAALVDGFRSAKFGATGAQVNEAITKDFGHKGDDIQTSKHPLEKTISYSVVVDELIPDSGKATISYILGYESESLMQISVVWGTLVEPEATLDKLKVTAIILRDHFLKRGFDSDKVITNRRADDGSNIVFQGTDEKGRTVMLQLAAPAVEQAEGTTESAPPVWLRLSYIEDPNVPDIFRVAKGQF